MLSLFGVEIMGSFSVRYDEEGDFLEVSSAKKKGYYKGLENGVFERVDEDGNTIGFAILNTKKREGREVSVPFEISFEKETEA